LLIDAASAARAKPALAASISKPVPVGAPVPPPSPAHLDETDVLPRVRQRNMKPVVFAIVGLLAALAIVAIVVSAMKKKPVVDEPVAAKTKESAEPVASTPPSSTASTKPSASVTTKPAVTPGKAVPPAGKKPPAGMGWMLVHGPGPDTRAFVAGKVRGEPETVFMAPCGPKIVVQLAKVSPAGTWRGWVGKGATTKVACDGASVAEVTINP
jgi:hypothetical protein